MDLDKFQKKLDKLFESKWFMGILIISIVLYLQTVKLNVDPKVSRVLNSNLFRLVVFSIIAYTTTKNIGVSIILSLGFVALLLILQKQKLLESFLQKNRVVNMNFMQDKPMNQPGILNMPRCDAVNSNYLPSFSSGNECLAYTDETNEYKLA
jgi:hypothetical protein